MADETSLQRSIRAFALVVCCAVLAAASTVAWAEPCTAPLTAAASAAGPGTGEKFRLSAQLCPSLAEPTQVHRAAQLGLYDAPAALAIQIPSAASAASGAAPAAPAPAAAATPPGPIEARILSLTPALTAAARANAIDPLLLHAVAHVESRHNPDAVSRAGARGVMQVMPATAQRFGVGQPERSLHDAATNLRAGAAYLRTLYERFGGDLRLVLAAYYAGEVAVAKYGNTVPPYPETQAYVRDVLAVYRRLTATFTVSRAGTLVARGDQP